ncbi:MAG: primosomal protein N' [Clostridiales Family XIII bacterium]|jgi:primosomal protein N' (replication factor Y)|nr:primosomal protein N' [Clostridiales Family XIII bacterium]
MKYVDVAIDNNSEKTDNLFTYGCGFDDVSVGSRVFAPFARGDRIRAAYVFSVKDELDEPVKGLKYIKEVDSELSLDAHAIEICLWMRRRYCCRYIEAVKCFVPAGSASKRGRERKPAFADIPEDVRHGLTEEQAAAAARIAPWIDESRFRIFLVHGVTGSGKTELYMQAVEKTVASGRCAIVLVPEISLTPQTIGRFIARFGQGKVAALHSKLSYGERYDEWMRVDRGEARVVIGARSAVFAPFRDIGLIIVDEEHEGAYKSDGSPKYDAIEVAIKRARQCGAVVMLGSATPSLTSTYRVERKLYERISLTKRYNETPLPSVSIVDMREEMKNGNKTIFSLEMYNAMDEELRRGRQVILFLNRRGYSAFVSCRGCGYVMKCGDCGISLTYHKAEDEAQCHICGARRSVPDVCPECGGRYLKLFGIGTEKVEETVNALFPDVAAERMDLDTIKKKGDLERIIGRFRRGKTKILIGTQLVAKGLDFSNVGLVGIVAADITLNIPDFKSAERAYQLITQAAGRAGRGDEAGHVIIQSYKPDHYAITAAANNDYAGFYRAELLMRKAMDYPPFSDLAQITVCAEDAGRARAEADALAGLLRGRADTAGRQRILGPGEAPIFRQGDMFRYQIYVKVLPSEREGFEGFMRESKLAAAGVKAKKDRYSVIVDINPYSFMT